jgi:hypothetical protein
MVRRSMCIYEVYSDAQDRVPLVKDSGSPLRELSRGRIDTVEAKAKVLYYL